MRRVAEELRNTGRLFAKNPGMVFVAVLVVGLAVSTVVDCCRGTDMNLSGNVHMSRLLRFSRADAAWRGARVDRAILRTLAYPRPLKKAKAPEKPSAPRPNAAAGHATGSASCAGFSDLRFPEFNFLTPPL